MSTIPSIRAVEFRLRAYRNDAPTDLTGFLTRARVSLGDVSTVGTGAAGGDGLSMTGDFTLINDRPGNDPLQPGARGSRFNQPNPLLSPNRRITLEVRTTPEGQAFGRWETIFDGLVNATKLQGNGSRVQIRAQDHAKLLQRTMIPGDQVYGSEGGQRLDVVIQQLINDNVPNPPTIRVMGTPDFWVEPYRPEFGSVWDAIQQLVTQAGWYFGMRRGPGGAFALTLMDPPREKTTPDWLFTGDDVITTDIDRDDIDVRNAFLIRYVDGATREPTQYPLAGPHVNQASVDALGGVQQLMIIELGDTSQIDTAAEAQALLARAEHDLSSMLEATQVELPIMPELNLFDMVGIDVAAVGNQQLFAVNSLEHTIEIPASGGNARYRTTISGASRVVGKYRDWIDLEVRPGSPNDKPGPHQTRLLAPRVSLLPGQPGFVVVVEAGPASRGVGAVGVEVHWSTINGFNPGPGTVRAAGPEERFSFAPNSNAPHYVRVRAYDEHERYGPYSPQLSIVPARVDGRWLVLDQNVQINGDLAIVGGGNDGTLLFYQDAIHPDNLRLAIGEVGGLFGAPSGAVGIAGPLGAGAWFEGVPRLVAAGSILCDATNPGPTVYEPAGGFMVRSGKKWLLQAWPSETVPPNGDVDWSLQQFYVNAFGRTSPDNASVKGSLPAGSYSNVWISAGAVYLKHDPLLGLLGAVWVNWQILEVDA